MTDADIIAKVIGLVALLRSWLLVLGCKRGSCFFWTFKDVDYSQKKGKDDRIGMSVLSVICCCKLKDVRDETETELICSEKEVPHDHFNDSDHHEPVVGDGEARMTKNSA